MDSIGAGALAQAWGCPCCLPVSFDPVPGLGQAAAPSCHPTVAARAANHSALQCNSCAAVDVADGTGERRNVVGQGLTRFELGIEAPEQPDWEQISPRIICVLGQNPSAYTLNGTNCYLVGTGKRRLLVDTGDQHIGAAEFMHCLAACMEENCVETLDGIIITHMHHDHYGNVLNLQAKYGPVPVYSRKFATDYFKMIHKMKELDYLQYFVDNDGNARANPRLDPKDIPPLPEGLDLSWAENDTSHFPGDTIGARMQYLFGFMWNSYKLIKQLECGELPWHALEEGMVIRTEGATLEALFTPGHSPDHMSFLLEEEHALFSGDHVLGWGTTFVADMRDYMSTLQRMLALKPTRLYPGHGGFIEDGVDLLERYIQHRERREDQAWDALQRKSRPVPIMEIVRELYPNTSAEKLWMAKDNVEKLFRKFAADGAAGVWTLVTDSNGAETIVPEEIPRHGYNVRRLQDGLLWAAKRSMLQTNQSKL